MLQRQITQAEQVERGVERLLGIVKALEQVLAAQPAQCLLQIDERLLDVLGDLRQGVVIAETGDAQHVEDEHAMIGGYGAAALRHDGGVRYLGFIAHALDVVDNVVGVFLQSVVDTRFEVGLRPVVIDSQSSAHVHVAKTRAGALQLHVHARRLHYRGLDLADVGDLAPQMKMEKLEAILHSGRLQLVERAQSFRDSQAEFRPVAARRLPPSGAPAGKLDAQSDHRPHADTRRMVQDEVEFRVLLDHRNDLPADLRGQHDHLNVLVVLKAVADDGCLIVGDGEHG